MITIRTFRIILLLWATSPIGAVVSYILFRHTLPPDLLAYKHSVAVSHVASPLYPLSLGVASVFLLVFIVSFIGLYRFSRFARPLFTIWLASAFVSVLFYGPRVETPPVAWFEDASTILGGIVLAVIYWSPLHEHFTKHKTAA